MTTNSKCIRSKSSTWTDPGRTSKAGFRKIPESCVRLPARRVFTPVARSVLHCGISVPSCPLWVKSGEDHQRGFVAHVRFAPKADKQQIVLAGPLGAKRRHSHCSRFSYSITSSARPSSVIGKASRCLLTTVAPRGLLLGQCGSRF